MEIMDTHNTSPSGTEIDPVCGMTVNAARAKATYEHAGKKYFFCCAGCQAKFSADPAKYLAPKTLMGIVPISAKPVQIAAAAIPAVSQPIGQIAAPVTAATPGTVSNEYTCPMDPEVRQEGPGDCPKCGMALEPTLAAIPATKTEYTCPMHSEIVRDALG